MSKFHVQGPSNATSCGKAGRCTRVIVRYVRDGDAPSHRKNLIGNESLELSVNRPNLMDC